MDGLNINCREMNYAQMIAAGFKKIETRNTNSLKSHIGRRVYLIQTGIGRAMVVGEATIGEPIVYNDVDEFDADVLGHRITPDSVYYFHGKKYGYPMENPIIYKKFFRVKPGGIIFRKNVMEV